MSYAETLRSKAADAAAERTAAFKTLSVHLLAEAKGDTLTAAQITANDAAVAVLGLSADEVAAMSAELAEVVKLEADMVRSAEAKERAIALHAELAAHVEKTNAYIAQAKSEEAEIAAKLQAAEGQASNLSLGLNRLVQLRQKYWQATRLPDPETIAKTRHIVSTLTAPLPSAAATVLDFEWILTNPLSPTNAVLFDESIIFEPLPGQQRKTMNSLLAAARDVVRWARERQHATSGGLQIPSRPQAFYLITGDTVPATNDHGDRLLMAAAASGNVDTYLLPFPGESMEAFKEARARIEKAARKASSEPEESHRGESFGTVANVTIPR